MRARTACNYCFDVGRKRELEMRCIFQLYYNALDTHCIQHHLRNNVSTG